jgi:hypothetical protein
MSRGLAASLRRNVGKKHQQAGKPASFSRGQHRASFRPCVERLEDRLAPAAPTVTSPIAASITPSTAVLGGNVTSDGGLVLDKRGVVYSLRSVNSDPTLGGKGVTEIDAPPYADTGAFLVTAGPLMPTSDYYFKAFATNPSGTGYTDVSTFSTSSGIVMPPSTVSPKNDQDWAVLNQVLFFQPAPGQTLPGSNTPVPQIPVKQVTITNNLTATVYPFMRDAAATIDPAASSTDLPPAQRIYQGFYDPIDQMNEEYRGYIGYSLNGVNYLGLPAGMTITVSVPLVFWDGARMEIGVDGTYLVTNAKVQASLLSPNPYQYYDKNPDGSTTARVALPALSSSGGPVGGNGQAATGMVMWYRQGVNNQTDRTQPAALQAQAPANDAPAQLTEWTMRDPVLSIINPNIDKLKPNYGETHANINYDVSYVDSMALPVAMEALDVPVPVQTVPALDPTNPNPGPRLPYGWIGAAQTPAEFQAALSAFASNTPANGLGSYFDGKGWPEYDFPAGAFPGGTPPIKVPSGQDVPQDTPLANKPSSYDILGNLYMLTSGGTTPIKVVNAGGSFSNNTKTLYILANTGLLQAALKYTLQAGMAVTLADGQPTGPDVPDGTTVQSIGPADNPGFNFTQYDPGNGIPVTVLEVQLNNTIPDSDKKSFVYNFNRVPSDYATTKLINLWYTWAKYYVDHVVSTEYPSVPGHSLTSDAKTPDNVIKLNSPAPGLQPGMLVTGSAGSGISPLRADKTGATTIESIDPDGETIHLSQAVGVSADGSTYSFAKPSMSSPAIAGYNQATILDNFTPTNNEISTVPNVLQFAQYAYQLLSLMSQIRNTGNGPISTQILGNVIGGSITNADVNGDAFHHTEVAYRTKVKSLLRGVNDFSVQNDSTKWYPEPSDPTGGQTFNVYNLDPFVWFVHKQMGLSGYGFSLDDDTADVSGNFSTKLGIAIGGLNGLPNQFEWGIAATYGPVSGTAKVLSNSQIAGLPPYVFFSVSPYNANEKILGANFQGVGVPAGTNLLSYGDGGLYTYSYILTDKLPPVNSPPLQIPPLVIGGTSQFTALGNGTVNIGPGPLILPADETQALGPYMNALYGVTVPSGGTLKVEALVGNLTSYTQQYEQMARVSIVPTSALNQNGTGPTTFVPGAPLPDLNTVVNGTLDAGRVNVVNGWLSGIGTVKGSLNVFGPVGGYDDPIELKPVHDKPVDPSWDNKKNTILGTAGGFLVAGQRSGTPGKLTVTSDVSMFDASFAVYAKGAATQGSDYSWLSSDGGVYLGSSKLDLALIGYTPRAGQSLTIITAAKGITGKFIQGNSITVNGFTFTITYNANSVVLTYRALLTSQPVRLAFLSQPGNPPAGGLLSPLWVLVVDALGRPVSGTLVRLSLVPVAAPPGAAFTPRSVVQAVTVNGVATFDRVAITLPGRYKLLAEVGGTSISSDPFNVE